MSRDTAFWFLGAATAGLLLAGLTSCRGSGNDPSANSADSADSGRRLVWAEEFEGPAGALPDTSRWRFDVGTGWGNAQLEYDTSLPENVSLNGDGQLAIVARRKEHMGSAYTSGRIHTNGRFAHRGGHFEARMRLPRGAGLWPAFWLLGANFDRVGWPACGEIDILEFRGQEPHIVHGSLHGPGFAGGHALTGRRESPDRPLDGEFHVYAVEWEPERITWFVDGVAYQSFGPADLPPGGEWVFDHPFFIILNLAVGGHFVGPPDSTTTFPAVMLVDWVRVYEEQTR